MKKQNKTIEQTIKTTFSAGIFFYGNVSIHWKTKKLSFVFFFANGIEKHATHFTKRRKKIILLLLLLVHWFFHSILLLFCTGNTHITSQTLSFVHIDWWNKKNRNQNRNYVIFMYTIFFLSIFYFSFSIGGSVLFDCYTQLKYFSNIFGKKVEKFSKKIC